MCYNPLPVCCVFRAQCDQAQDAQGDRNTTSVCLIHTFSCETIMLDPDSPHDTNATKEILALKEPEDQTSGTKYSAPLDMKHSKE